MAKPDRRDRWTDDPFSGPMTPQARAAGLAADGNWEAWERWKTVDPSDRDAVRAFEEWLEGYAGPSR